MLILPAGEAQKQAVLKHQQDKEGLTNHYNSELERILNENSDKQEKYWVLGKVRFPQELGGHVGRAFLQASDSKPVVIRDAFLYEVDNKRGVKTLLWVCYPNGDLRIPSLNKTIKLSKKPRRQSLGA